MKMNLSLPIVFSLLLCTSCEKMTLDFEKTSQIDNSTLILDRPNLRNQQEAIDEAKLFINGLKTRNNAQTYIIGDTYTYLDSLTNTEKPLFYIVKEASNYDQGYTIVSADTEYPTILASSQNGNLSLQDTSRYQNIALFFNLLHAYLTNPDNRKYQLEEDREPTIITKGRRHPINEKRAEEWIETEKIPPLIKTLWGQSKPYNNMAPLIDDKNALTGCVATAIAQVMAFHEKPKSYKNITFDWKEMKDNPANPATGHLFRFIGDLVDMDWGLKSSGASRNKIPKCFEAMGYRRPNAPQVYSQGDVIASIKSSCPVIICGNSIKKSIVGIKYYKSGHAWIIDGYFHRERKINIFRKNKYHHSYQEKEDYLHLNWGWDGNSNGYYLAGVFTGGNGPIYPSTKAGANNYPYNLEIIPYINIIK